MSVTRHHAEWLSLLEVSGPFLSMPVLLKGFPQGLDAHDAEISRSLRLAYEEWDDNQTGKHPNSATHSQFTRFVLTDVLKFPEETMREGQTIPQALKTYVPEQGETLRPDLAIYDPGEDPKPRLLIQVHPYGTDLEKPLPSKHWKATPATRMMELLHGVDCRLGLITNGERWMLVDARRGESTGFASWYASLWLEEQITLRSFKSLLSAHRFFAVPTEETLEALLTESAVNQQEVTDQLGYQVRQAVEVLVESIDRADQDSGRKLTEGINEKVLYEAALAVMMRLVFLMCAEERKLLLLGDPIYDQNYAISTLQAQLREAADQHGEEILEHRFDAWSRLLATFRAVHAGMQHDRMLLPAYGGHLFDPDRYPFLEGRKSETSWRTAPASPLPINNRTVLHALEALQFLQVKVNGGGPAERRRLSFRALDVEQIGYVYEGLLDHTAKRASEPVLGLRGTKDKEPEILLVEIERRFAQKPDEFYSWLKEETGRGESALKNSLTTEIEGHDINRFHAACGNDNALWARVRPFAGFVREDTFGDPVVILPGGVYVTEGEDRRTTGTHYTPKSLTEPIVQYTLEPLVYSGPAEGRPRQEWKLRSAHELLDLRICDMTTGSGAFLAQACRYLSERLLEAWEILESEHPGTPGITPEGKASNGLPAESLIPKHPEERLTYARRIVAQRCLYGVDKNPLAVEMAKLSLWLLTMAKSKPFTFLDHNIRCGDSLVGVGDQQLKEFSLGSTDNRKLFLQDLPKRIDQAIAFRKQIANQPTLSVADLESEERLLRQAEEQTDQLRLTADFLLAPEFTDCHATRREALRTEYAVRAAAYLSGTSLNDFKQAVTAALKGRSTFHWFLEFPEAFKSGGFDAIIGNPPFLGGKRICLALGDEYNAFLKMAYKPSKGAADLCAYFFRRAHQLLKQRGTAGLLATNTIAQADTKEVGLDVIATEGGAIFRAVSRIVWPGGAVVHASAIDWFKGQWKAPCFLDGVECKRISTRLIADVSFSGTPGRVNTFAEETSHGTGLLGIGFVVEIPMAEAWVAEDPRNADVLLPYVVGQDLNDMPVQIPRRYVIDFGQRSEDEASTYKAPFARVVELVKPQRDKLTRQIHETCYWKHWDKREQLYLALKPLSRVMVCSLITAHLSFVFLPKGWIYSKQLAVFPTDRAEHFGLLQCSYHDFWARLQSSTMKSDLSYSVSDAFRTYPLPKGDLSKVAVIAEKYYLYRGQIMAARKEGVTKTYNRFHDQDDNGPDIVEFRNLHIALDKAVAEAYGWTSLSSDYAFRDTSQGIRFTVSDGVKQTVLANLFQLNNEQKEGLRESPRKKTRRSRRIAATTSLFE